MIEIPVLDSNGKKVGAEALDPALLGGRVRFSLLKQAVVAYRANLRLGTAVTRSRGLAVSFRAAADVQGPLFQMPWQGRQG